MIAYVINLDKDRDRLAWVTREAKRAGISLERFAGVDGHKLDQGIRSQFFADGSEAHEPALTAGEIGCYASHLCVLEKLLADEREAYALVLEDDIHIAEDLVPTIESARRLLPHWDIIRLSNATKSVVLPVASLPNNREVVRYWTVPNGAGAYLISRSGAEKFLKAYSTRTMPIDEDLRRPWRNGLDTYGILPPPVKPDVLGESSIARMGRPAGIPARRRFRHAAQDSDRLARLGYRLRLFGAGAFCRAIFRVAVARAVKRVLGARAAKHLWRLRPVGKKLRHVKSEVRESGQAADCASG